MRKNVLAGALAGLVLPALALAGQPIFIRVSGRSVPLREVVQVVHTAAGPVRVHTWSWRGPNGATTFQVSESRGAAPLMPTWALAQLRAMQAQMAQMQLLQTALAQPLMMMPAPPVPVMFGAPLLMSLPGQAPLEVRFLRPMIPLRVVPAPSRVLVIVPARSAPAVPAPAPKHHSGHLV